MIRSKNIVERFVKPTDGEKKRTNNMLKASSSSSFKVQKPKKIHNQWEKAKPTLITPDLNKPSLPRKIIQHDLGGPILEIRPLDSVQKKDIDASREDERIPSMSPMRGFPPSEDV